MNDSGPLSVLSSVLASVADKMVPDFQASGVAQHRGSKGTVSEAQLLDNYLRKYLPGNVIAEHSAEVVATNGDVSRQCDIVIMDPSTPPFWSAPDLPGAGPVATSRTIGSF